MREKYSLEKTLGVEVEINKKHLDLIVTNKDLSDIITRGLLLKTGLHASLKLTELLSRGGCMTLDMKDGLYYRSDKFMTVITNEDLLYGVFQFALKNVVCWDKADSDHISKYENVKIFYGQISVSNLTDKGITEIVKLAVKSALKRIDISDEENESSLTEV